MHSLVSLEHTTTTVPGLAITAGPAANRAPLRAGPITVGINHSSCSPAQSRCFSSNHGLPGCIATSLSPASLSSSVARSVMNNPPVTHLGDLNLPLRTGFGAAAAKLPVTDHPITVLREPFPEDQRVEVPYPVLCDRERVQPVRIFVNPCNPVELMGGGDQVPG